MYYVMAREVHDAGIHMTELDARIIVGQLAVDAEGLADAGVEELLARVMRS